MKNAYKLDEQIGLQKKFNKKSAADRPGRQKLTFTPSTLKKNLINHRDGHSFKVRHTGNTLIKRNLADNQK